MRIIRGTMKGRKLGLWSQKIPVRPMTDRVKETVFNVLSPYFFEDCLFLDLFSGTGNLALEALSRGARQAHAVEKHPLCIRMIKKNSQLLDNTARLVVHKRDVFVFLKQALKGRHKKRKEINPFDIIVADPPFAIYAGHSVMEKLQNSFLTKKGTIAIVETGKKESLKNNYSSSYLFSKKTFGDKKVWFYEFQ